MVRVQWPQQATAPRFLFLFLFSFSESSSSSGPTLSYARVAPTSVVQDRDVLVAAG